MNSSDKDISFEINACNFSHEAIVPMSYARNFFWCSLPHWKESSGGHAVTHQYFKQISFFSKEMDCSGGNPNHVGIGVCSFTKICAFGCESNEHFCFAGSEMLPLRFWFFQTSWTIHFFIHFHVNFGFQPADPKHDWRLFLIETLEDRRTLINLFYRGGSNFADCDSILRLQSCWWWICWRIDSQVVGKGQSRCCSLFLCRCDECGEWQTGVTQNGRRSGRIGVDQCIQPHNSFSGFKLGVLNIERILLLLECNYKIFLVINNIQTSKLCVCVAMTDFEKTENWTNSGVSWINIKE